MAEEVTRATAQTVQALSQVRDQLIQACGELEQTRLQLDMLNKTETPRSVPEDHIGDATPTIIHKTVQQDMRKSSDQPHWRCVAVTRDGRNTNRLRIIGRYEEEIQKIKTILETRKPQVQEAFETNYILSKLIA
ncbi:hypothetical protein FOWG_17881 [Fusarium oxysporum f. sp. lycopersici MN25]|nr:hypothetical protein FOWG_17881 [Fusarium oxysporum f. sp. lycopersici MN25]